MTLRDASYDKLEFFFGFNNKNNLLHGKLNIFP